MSKERLKHYHVWLVYGIALCVGVVVSFLMEAPQNNYVDNLILLANFKNLRDIFLQNSFVIVLIYVISFFNSYLPFFIIIQNGCILGVTISWIFQNNISLLLLILPHGVFEIPCLLASAFIIVKGKKLFKNNPQRIVKALGQHVALVFLVALIEVYVTPIVYNLIFN